MRLSNYITEQHAANAYKEAIKNTEIIMYGLYRALEKRGFDLENNDNLIRILNGVSESITPVEFSSRTERGKLGKFIVKAQFVPRKGGKINKKFIEIEIDDNTFKYFRRFAREEKKKLYFDMNKNQFARELIDLLSHEIVHKMQYMINRGRDMFVDTTHITDYLADRSEIDAFSVQAAIQLETTGRSFVWKYLKKATENDDMHISNWQRFVKKVSKYREEIKEIRKGK